MEQQMFPDNEVSSMYSLSSTYIETKEYKKEKLILISFEKLL